MKRLIYLVLCLFTCITFMTACGNDNDTTNEPQVQSESQDDITNDNDADDQNAPVDKTNGAQELEIGDVTDLPDAEVTEEEDNESQDNNDADSGLTVPQQNAAESPQEEFHASGTFNGFIDSSSVEITMADGSYQTFFVYEEDVHNRLMSLSDSETPPTIQFIYKAKEGQINPEIIALN